MKRFSPPPWMPAAGPVAAAPSAALAQPSYPADPIRLSQIPAQIAKRAKSLEASAAKAQ
jgi:hypothetical protein